MTINKNFISINKYSRPGIKLKTDKPFIIWHYEGNPGGTGEKLLNYARSGIVKEKACKGYHVSIGDDGIFLIVPFDEVAYHVGLKNISDYTDFVKTKFNDHAYNYTVGIECCHIDETGKYSKKTYQNMIDFGVYLCKTYNLNPIYSFRRHFDLTKKVCPKWMVEQPNAWQDFLNDILIQVP